IFFILAITYSFNLLQAQIVSGSKAKAVIKTAESVASINDDYLPAYIKFAKGEEINLDSLQSWLSSNFKLSPGFGLKLIRSEKDQYGYTHYRYRQTINGYPVLGGDYIAHTINNKIISLNGKIKKYIESQTNIGLSENAAILYALDFVKASQYKWQIPEEEKFIKYITGNPDTTFYPKGELTIVPEKGDFSSKSYRLAYRFDIYASEPLSRKYVFVDAITGNIITTIDEIHNSDVTGTAVTKYSGNQTITADSYVGSYRLRETGRGNGIETYDMNKGTVYGSAVDFTDADNYWNNINIEKDEVATDAHWGAEKTYDYYYTKFGRNSIDDIGFKLISYVHYGVKFNNAFWDGQRMTYGDGNGTSYSPFTALDICGHEITHGLDSYTADLLYQDESGALNEGFSDIFGCAIEFYAKPTSANWTMGENVGTASRSLENPNLKGQPDTYHGNYWYSGTGDYGGVHTNSGVLNYWFYLTSQGGSGTNDLAHIYNVTGIGIDKASAIAYRTITYYLNTSSDYGDARTFSILACQDLYGGCSEEAEAVTNAWYAVGIGDAWSVTTTIADFTTCSKMYCSAPAAVQFNNISSHANTFKWYFGDGNTSTESNPSHTYNSLGNYDVKLVVNGSSCGSDSVTKIAFISISVSNPCPVNMPQTGGTTKTTCKGTLYDSGGCGDYQNSTDATITISPTVDTTITLNFVSFNFELNYDYLYIYDGPTTLSPLIGRYTGTNLPNGGIIISSGNSLTIRQTSDAAVVASGFELNWACASSEWTGATSTDWNIAANWNPATVPTQADNVNIPWGVSNAPHITSNPNAPAQCNNIKINAGAILTINAGKALTIAGNYINNGTLAIKSAALGDGSLLTNGTITGTGTTKVTRYIASNKWHLVSSPITSALSSVFNGLYLRPYDESTDAFGAYITQTSAPLSVGQGYSLWSNANSTPVFSGTLNNGTVGPLAIVHTLNGYNLVGNPYPSAIDWNAASGWTKTNLAGTIYVWNPSAGEYATYNGSAGTNGGSNYIAMGQGFFVQAASDGASLTMNNSVRVHNTIAFQKSGKSMNDQINIKISNSVNTYSDETIIALNSNASDAFDYNLDANKFQGEITAPMLYTMKDEKNLAVSNFASIDNIYNRDVYFHAGVIGTHTLTFTHTLVSNDVYLKDKVTQEIIHNGDIYAFEASPTDELNRFLIINVAASVNEKTQDNLNVYSYHNTLYVKVENQYVNSIELYTLEGRKIFENTNLINDISHLSSGIYFVKVKTDKDVLCKKIVIQ
ncbi:MAG: PKD domain-containing protein, partial [Bacteroidetes bacterium]|nr:PKD domain-containing protein [Bacteroidota bacterium]